MNNILNNFNIDEKVYKLVNDSEKELSDDVVERICDLTHYLYLKDEYYNFSSSRIADYITIGHLEHNIPIEKLEEVDKSDMYMGIDTDDYDWLLENEMER